MATDKTARADRLIADAVRNRLGREAGYRKKYRRKRGHKYCA